MEDSPGWISVLDDLPALIVENFSVLTPLFLQRKYEEIVRKPQRYNFNRLTSQWWIDRVRALLPANKHYSTSAPADLPTNTTCDPSACVENYRPKADCCVIDGGNGECSSGFTPSNQIVPGVFDSVKSEELCWHNEYSNRGPEFATLFSYRLCCVENVTAVKS